MDVAVLFDAFEILKGLFRDCEVSQRIPSDMLMQIQVFKCPEFWPQHLHILRQHEITLLKSSNLFQKTTPVSHSRTTPLLNVSTMIL